MVPLTKIPKSYDSEVGTHPLSQATIRLSVIWLAVYFLFGSQVKAPMANRMIGMMREVIIGYYSRYQKIQNDKFLFLNLISDTADKPGCRTFE